MIWDIVNDIFENLCLRCGSSRFAHNSIENYLVPICLPSGRSSFRLRRQDRAKENNIREATAR